MARLTLRLDFGPGRAIGHGKIRLLEAVRDHGSISAAGRSMGMSYRRAWLLVDALNRLFETLGRRDETWGLSRRRRRAHTLWSPQYRTIEVKAHEAVARELSALAAATARFDHYVGKTVPWAVLPKLCVQTRRSNK